MNIGVIFAGGVGKRMNSKDKPKQFLAVHGKPIIVHTIEIFETANEPPPPLLTQCLGHSQAREDMSTRATRHDQSDFFFHYFLILGLRSLFS